MGRPNHWIARNPAAIDSLLFTGAPTLVTLVESLLHRPDIRHADKPLPIVYLLASGAGHGPLGGIDDRLSQLRRTVTSRLLPDDPPGSTAEALNRVVADLSGKVKGVARLRFPHYCLAVWLDTLVPEPARDRQPDGMDRLVDDKLNEHIRNRFPVSGAAGDHADLVDQFPWYVRLLARPLPRLAMWTMRLLWRPPRWLAKQHEIGRRHARSFRTLTRAFMASHGPQVGNYPVRQLLVDAFLEDLSRAYRRTTLFGRGRRRTSYPVLLADVPAPAGPDNVVLDLLGRIATARDAAGQRGSRPIPYRADPLLVVAAGPDPAPGVAGSEPMARPAHSVADGRSAYDEWLRERRQARGDWFLRLRVPADGPADGARDRVTRVPLTRIRVSRTAPILLTVLLLATTAVVADRTYEHCGTWYWQSNLDREGEQCVGLAPPGYRFYADLSGEPGITDELRTGLREVEDRIHATNDEFVRAGPGFLTVVYLSSLSARSTAGYQRELENLRGIEIAQTDMRESRRVRVLLANAGAGMDHGRAAAESIADEAAADPTLLGVLGMGISREGTREAMIRLHEARIPMIGTSISATSLAEKTTEYYHQVGPTNEREAAIAARYAKTELKVHKVHLYYAGDPRDLYSSDLRDQARAAFTRQGIEVEESPYKIAPADAGIDPAQLGGQACDVGPDAVAFYAGRAERLTAFLNGMKSRCEGDYPKLISGDDATRFVLAHGGLSRYPNLSMDYLSFGSSLAWGEDCTAATGGAGFFVGYVDHYGSACVNTRDGGAMLAYDSFLAFDQAVRNAPQDSAGMPTTDGVLAGLNEISDTATGALRGASGKIDFGRGGHPVPVDKAVMLLRATGAGPPSRVLLCGVIWTAQPPPDTDGCPPAEP